MALGFAALQRYSQRQQKLRGHTTTPRSEAAALARRRWAVGFGARAPARTHDKAPRRAVKPPPSPAAGANSRARPTPNLGWRTCGAMGAAHAPRSAWTVQVRSGETPRSPGPAARATDLRAAGPRAHARARSAALGVMGPATDTPTLAEPLKVSLLPSLLQQTPGGHAGWARRTRGHALGESQSITATHGRQSNPSRCSAGRRAWAPGCCCLPRRCHWAGRVG